MSHVGHKQSTAARAWSRVAGGCAMLVVLLNVAAQASPLDSALPRIDSLNQLHNYDAASSAIAALVADSLGDLASADTLLPLLFTIGNQFIVAGRLSDAQATYRISVRIVSAANPDDPLSAVNDAGYQAWTDGEPLCAEVMTRHALDAWRSADNPKFIPALVQLGNILLALYRSDEGQQLYEEAATLARARFGEQDCRTAAAEWGLANLYLTQQRLALAEPLYDSALIAFTTNCDSNRANIASLRLNLGMVYSLLHRYERAWQELDTVLMIFESNNHPGGAARTLSFMSELAQEEGDVGRAEELLLRAIAAATEGFGYSSPWTNARRAELTDFYLRYREVDKAEQNQREVLRIVDSLTGPNSPATADELVRMGRVLLGGQRPAKADSLFRRAMDIAVDAFGKDSPMVSDCLTWRSRCARSRGEWDRAVQLAEHALRLRQGIARDFSLGGSERDALLYAQNVREVRDLYLSVFWDRADGSMTVDSLTVDAIVSGKGDISDVMFQRRQMLARPMDSIAADLWESYRLTQGELSDMFVRGPRDGDLKAFRAALDSMTMVANQLEAHLAQHLATFDAVHRRSHVSCAEICREIPDNAALVEYLRYACEDSLVSNPGHPRYLVLVMQHQGVQALRDLGPAEVIDHLVGEYRDHLRTIADRGTIPTHADLDTFSVIADSLYQRLWSPIDDALTGSRLVLIAPDGELNRISFATLKPQNGSYLIESTQIHYLSAGRDLLRPFDSLTMGKDLLALGDPDFAAGVTRGDSIPPQLSIPMSELLSHRIPVPCDRLGDLNLEPLPGALNEIREVISIWANGDTTKSLQRTGANATEAEFKKYAPGRLAIHLVTHGYFIPSECMRWQIGESPKFGLAGDDMPNPLLQSGFCLAECTIPVEMRDACCSEDGVLTASEIAAMDFSGTELVVLSACRTGIGALRIGEGVYGLRRAFQMAGARTVVSALWSIADEFTAPMLPTLYRHAEVPLPERLQHSQLDWIHRLRARGFADHPFAWGAFIAEGRWY